LGKHGELGRELNPSISAVNWKGVVAKKERDDELRKVRRTRGNFDSLEGSGMGLGLRRPPHRFALRLQKAVQAS